MKRVEYKWMDQAHVNFLIYVQSDVQEGFMIVILFISLSSVF